MIAGMALHFVTAEYPVVNQSGEKDAYHDDKFRHFQTGFRVPQS